jgi:hypothetical protein
MCRKNIFFTLTVIFMVLNFTGCTILGYKAGAKIDANRAVIQPPTLEKLQKIKKDTPIKLQVQNTPIIAGTFQGIEKIDPAEYGQRYASFCSDFLYGQSFPAMNDTITLRKKLGFTSTIDASKYRFSGFDLNSICLQSLPDNQIRVKKLDSLITIIDQRGKKMNAQTIRGYVNGGVVPLRSELTVKVNNEMQRIGGEKIIRVELPKYATGRIVFSLVGLSIDILIYRAFVWQMNQSFKEGMRHWGV